MKIGPIVGGYHNTHIFNHLLNKIREKRWVRCERVLCMGLKMREIFAKSMLFDVSKMASKLLYIFKMAYRPFLKRPTSF